MHKLFGIIICFISLSLAGAVGAATVDITAAKDNTLYKSSDGGKSNGAGGHFIVGRDNSGVAKRGVMAFDIAENIPAGATVDRVTLHLNLSRTSVGAVDISLHRLLSDWGEGTSDARGGPTGGSGDGGPSTAGDATWLHTFYPADFWKTPGGDFSAAISGTTTVNALGGCTWGSTSQMVVDVQSWLDSPSRNFGWILIGPEEVRSTKRFDSRENEAPANWPMLTVDFTPPAFPVVGALPGMNSQMLKPSEKVELVLNVTNPEGAAPSEIKSEWFVLAATIRGVNLGVFFITAKGGVPLNASTDLAKATFPFNHEAGDTFSIGTLSMADLTLNSGDTLIYAYAYTTTDLRGIVIPNIVVNRVR